MDPHISRLLEQIAGLKRELADELHKSANEGHYQVLGSRVQFTPAKCAEHRQVKLGVWAWLRQCRPRALMAAPVIYGMTMTLLILDLTISIYQIVCFPLYGMAKVRRRDYFRYDRQHLAYLNAIEKINCTYCSYANGLFAYSTEIAARTEQFFCPIKHALKVAGAHSRYAQFLDFGDSTDYHVRAEQLQREMAKE